VKYFQVNYSVLLFLLCILASFTYSILLAVSIAIVWPTKEAFELGSLKIRDEWNILAIKICYTCFVVFLSCPVVGSTMFLSGIALILSIPLHAITYEFIIFEESSQSMQ
jgi:hypothetical protein